MTNKDFSYYNFDKVLSRNAVINMIMGARGLGKTYGAKKIVIKNAVKHGEQFIYLRRYKTELKGRASFFADIAHEFPGFDFRVNGNLAQFKSKDEKDWRVAGYFIPLSTSQSNKSNAYPKVTTIIFDEFIIEKGSVHYLPNEVKTFHDFYSTVDRWQDRTKVLMLSNSISIMNPYFIEYEVTPSSEFLLKAGGFVCAHFVDSELFASEVARTRFGSFITRYASEYADYSISNNFADNNDDFVMKKTGKARYNMSLRTKHGVFSVWIDGANYFIDTKRPRNNTRNYVIAGVTMREGEIMLAYSDKILQILRSAYKNGNMWFKSQQARNIFSEVFKR